MSLRTRLIIAFLLLSVVPLTAVTVMSYLTSRRALERTAEAETRALTAEMGQRMELVTADLERRVDQLWDARMQPARSEGTPAEAGPPDMQGQAAAFLGQAAHFLDRIEFTPVPPPASPRAVGTGASAGGRAAHARAPRAAPESPRTPQVPAPPTSPAPDARADGEAPSHPKPPPAPPAPDAPIVIDLHKAIADATRDDPDARRAAEQARKFVEQLQAKLGPLAQAGVQAAAVGLRIGAAELARVADERRAALDRKRVMKLTESTVDMPIERDGAVVARVNAHLDLKEILRAVLTLANRDQGEIPFAIDADRQIYTVAPKDRQTLESLKLTEQSGLVRSDDPWIVVKRQDPTGVTFGIARPIGASLAEIRGASLRNLGLGLAVTLIALIGIIPMSRHMTRDLSTLTNGVRAIARGDLQARVPVRSHDEFGELAGAFNQMARDLAEHQKLVVEQEGLHRELELCRQIQNEMLPREPLRLGLTEVKGVSIPAREVGGDFFNYFLLPEGQIALLVGDVSGKGVSAALLMANIQATLRARLALERDLVALIDAIDREVDANTPRGVFLTLFVAVLDPQTRTLRYVNAGHNPQYLLRGTGELEHMTGTGLPVGLFAGHGYRQQSLALADGDLLFFYTDGMVEVENQDGEFFGSERLEALLARAHDEGIDHLLARIESAFRGFRGEVEPFDDATMMALRLGGLPASV